MSEANPSETEEGSYVDTITSPIPLISFKRPLSYKEDESVSYIHALIPVLKQETSETNETIMSSYHLVPRLPVSGHEKRKIGNYAYHLSFEPENPYEEMEINPTYREAFILWNHRIQRLFHQPMT